MIEYSLTYAQQRASDLQAEAAAHALAQEALSAHDSRLPFYAPVLAGVGRQLGALGNRLERRYAEYVGEAADMLASPREETPQWS